MKPNLTAKTREIKQDRLGKILSFSSIAILLFLVIIIVFFITGKGVLTFTNSHVNPLKFLTDVNWNTAPGKNGQADIGALALITTSLVTTLSAALIATPLSLISAIYIVFFNRKLGERFVQPLIELLLGIPSVVYGFVGLTVLVPLIRKSLGGTGFGILAGSVVLALMILPTITSLTVEALRSVPKDYQNFALTLGTTRWQMIYHVVLKICTPSIIVSIIYGIARAFGEALAVQMVIGNTVQLPTTWITPTATLTSKLTTDIGNTIDGTLPNNALWTLALILLIMSLIFNLIAKFIVKRQVKL